MFSNSFLYRLLCTLVMIEELKQNQVVVDRLLEEFIPQSVAGKTVQEWIGSSLPAEAVREFLTVPVWDFLSRGGKRWRPLLLYTAIEAVGGSAKGLERFGLVPELIHNGTLIIDDIEDGSDLRRGRRALHLLYGVDVAINAGNILYYLPLIIIRDSSLDDKTKVALYELVNDEMLRIGFGQGADIVWHKEQPSITEQDYVTMCQNKTGTLARMAAKMGAILGSGSKEQVDVLGVFAQSLGVAFQIQDDILNLEGSVGKSVGDDITEGKLSLPMLRTLSTATAADVHRLQEVLRKHTKDAEEIREALQIIRKYDGIEYSKREAQRIVSEAWRGVETHIPQSEAKKKLKGLLEFMVSRSN